ncbi:pyruvate dehydrogenase E2 component (dihydrolipoamide acetyltransferase) [Streptomyces umbrinus]|uniref:dihydrolipoamide acetyltransferase family protein n=1 Tax=Streptomyces umbrinus TaxID=67370 RepID=UPI00167C67B7|nr:dihydrolipoamide acetyltransferase family protein [Streptomyces umbrinus]MCR3724893.1 pyruvate dehydrogenase E2 component (dihydrolipoamide acetyltransferase) [Streptomyces umbrinus]GHH61038.1 dihydrolipoamide acetyltransferase component of pyruvate dehydrogenase complex [Streptomyces umbrinus]
MSKEQVFLLPDVGEGLTEAEILQWSVQVGDSVEINQVIVEVETAKAAVELPSPYAGVVGTLHAKEGEALPVGKPLITVLGDVSGASDVTESPSTDAATAPDREALLVGYGPQEGSGRRRRRRPVAPPAQQSPAPTPVQAPAAAPAAALATERTAAKPPVRKLAKDLGVDITVVTPTGPGATVTRDDVRRAAEAEVVAAEAPKLETPEATATVSAETRIPIRGVRKHTAAAMVASAFTAPHVTEFMTVDVTATMRLRDTVAARREFRDLRVTPLLFVARALLLALRNTPEANASWDEPAQEIVLKHYVNLGIAAATGRGLIVPNIKHADRMSLRELAEALAALTSTAREGRTTPQSMTGGTITITNVGVFGVDTGTPILNPGEAAILAVGAIRRTPWVVTDASGAETIEPRWVTQLALSFDHRLVDGQQGSQLLADLGAFLHDPGLAML